MNTATEEQRDFPGVLGGPANMRPLWTRAVASSQGSVTRTEPGCVGSGSFFIWLLAPNWKDYLCCSGRGRLWLACTAGL